ncbi:MAG: D-sedoheptulose 7-phosphate isomerase [Nanoarchaeota archaeon]
MKDAIRSMLKESAQVKLKTAETLTSEIQTAAEKIIGSYKQGGKLIIFGNGGSAADAQHITTELMHQFEKNRRCLLALALNTNTSMITAIGNDWGFEDIFSRQVEGLATPKDVIIAISTSGNSKNVIKAVKLAKEKGTYTICFTNQEGGILKDMVDLCLCVPHKNTARVQECHITIGHILCKLIEENLFPDAGTRRGP